VSVLTDAKAHLSKAEEFLDAAQLLLEYGLVNAAVSSSVTSGINAKDAICLKTTGHTEKADNHQHAVKELKLSGPSASGLAQPLGRLLRLKAKSQYQAASVTESDARKAVEWARRLHEGALIIVRP